MLLLLSPSKTLDECQAALAGPPTQPIFINKSSELAQKLRGFSPKKLQTLMDISPKLAALNHQRFKDFSPPFTPHNAKQAILLFKGDVYDGLAVSDFTKQDFAFANQRLRMISGLYGLLRPLDLMQPYRLEMGTALKIGKYKNLYQFWGDAITEAINKEEKEIVVNLASTEYFSAVQPKKLKAGLITPVFKERKGGAYKVIGLFAKKARGQMARYAVKGRLTQADALKNFTEDGYRYNESMSNASEWVFTRG